MQVWGRSLEFWDSVTVWLMWIAAICGGTAAVTGLAGAIISRQVSATIQRDADERISATNAVAAKAKLDLEQLRTQVAPRQFIRPAFLDALRGEPAGNVEIVFLRNDPECFDVAQQLWHLLQDAGWQVTPPTAIFDGRQNQPAPMNADGEPSGLTVVASVNSQAEIDASQLRATNQPWAHTPFTVLEYAIARGIGKVATHVNGPNRPQPGTLRVVVAPR